MPTYDKKALSFQEKSIKEIIGATCQAEVVHELMLVEALIPLILIIPYGKAIIFISTTLLCIFIELVFIIIQRYNRPRFVKLYLRGQRLYKNN